MTATGRQPVSAAQQAGEAHLVDVGVPVADLLAFTDPQYWWDEDVEAQAWQVAPNWDKVRDFATAMAAGTFDFAKADSDDGLVHLLRTPTGGMLVNGNHRVLAAHLAGLEVLAIVEETR